MNRPSPGHHFATTRWTMVLSAAGSGKTDAAQAMAELCEAYWFPLYAYVRNVGRTKEDAEDLTQAFFERLLKKGMSSGLDAANGRFRAFLLTAMKHFMANDWDRRSAAKRGGASVHLGLDWDNADRRFTIAGASADEPDARFDREWATTLLSRVVENLSREFAARGKSDEFGALKSCLTEAKEDLSYGTIAAALAIDEGAARVRVHRLRKRYRELLRREISDTLSDPAMADEELAVLLTAFART